MASPNAVFTELVTTTFRKHSKDIKDNISKNNALLDRLTVKGTRKEDGGLSIVAPLDYAANGTYQRYSGYDVVFDVFRVLTEGRGDQFREDCIWACHN